MKKDIDYEDVRKYVKELKSSAETLEIEDAAAQMKEINENPDQLRKNKYLLAALIFSIITGILLVGAIYSNSKETLTVAFICVVVDLLIAVENVMDNINVDVKLKKIKHWKEMTEDVHYDENDILLRRIKEQRDDY